MIIITTVTCYRIPDDNTCHGDVPHQLHHLLLCGDHPPHLQGHGTDGLGPGSETHTCQVGKYFKYLSAQLTANVLFKSFIRT